MAEKKVFEGLYLKSLLLQPVLGLLERQNSQHQLKESLTTGRRPQQSWTLGPWSRVAPWSVNLCPNSPNSWSPPRPEGQGSAGYMDFMPLAVVPSGSPSLAVATSCRPE